MDYLTTSEFEKFYANKFSKAQAKGVVGHFVKNPSSSAKVGISVGKHLKLNAVQRNKIRRWTREFFVVNPLTKNIWLNLVIVEKPKSFQDLSNNFKELLTKIK